MKPYIFKYNNFEIRIYSIMYILSLFIGIFVAKKDKINRERLTLKDNQIEDYAYIVLISGLIGARIYYCLFNINMYINDPISILYIWQGGLAIHGGIIGGIIGICIYSKIKKQDILALFDLTVSPLILGQALGRIGNFFNGEIHGVPTLTPLKVIFTGKFNEFWQMYQTSNYEIRSQYSDLVPWGIVFPADTPAGIEFPNYALHPAMIYELILNLIAFILMYFVLRKRNLKKGILSAYYLIFYGLIRIFVSHFRSEDLMIYGIRLPYIASFAMILVAIILIINSKKVKNR